MLKIIDLFSGAGGLTEGFRDEESFEFICHIEVDKAACATLTLRNIYHYLKKKNNLELYNNYINGIINENELYSMVPDKLINDVWNIEINNDTLQEIFQRIDKATSITKVDGIIGGPPCQAYSTIGRAKNKEKKSSDERVYLYKYYIEFLRRYEPDFFVFENVKGLLSFKDERGELLFPKIKEDFEKVGYHLEDELVDAQEYGIPQRRERLILVGFKKNLRRDAVFFSNLKKYKEASPDIQTLFKDLPRLKAGDKSNNYAEANPDVYTDKYLRNATDNFLTFHEARRHNKNDLEIYRLVVSAKEQGINLMYNELPIELQTHSNKTAFLDRYKALSFSDVSHTVVAHIAKDGHYYIHPDINQNRSITVREAARIQSFDDSYFFLYSRTSAFKQIGNAVPPILSNKIANAIKDTLC